MRIQKYVTKRALIGMFAADFTVTFHRNYFEPHNLDIVEPGK